MNEALTGHELLGSVKMVVTKQTFATIINILVTQNTLFMAITAGVCFGIWPHFQKAAGLSGIHSPMGFILYQAAIALPIYLSLVVITKQQWSWRLDGTALLISAVLFSYCVWRWPLSMYALFAALFSTIGLFYLTRIGQLAGESSYGPLLGIVLGTPVLIAGVIHVIKTPADLFSIKIIGFTLIAIGCFFVQMKGQ